MYKILNNFNLLISLNIKCTFIKKFHDTAMSLKNFPDFSRLSMTKGKFFFNNWISKGSFLLFHILYFRNKGCTSNVWLTNWYLLFKCYIKFYAICYLDIDKQLPQVPGRHDDCRIELNDVALIQRNVVVSCESLLMRNTSVKNDSRARKMYVKV